MCMYLLKKKRKTCDLRKREKLFKVILYLYVDSKRDVNDVHQQFQTRNSVG